ADGAARPSCDPRAPGWRTAALRLRRGDPAAADALGDRPARPGGGFPQPLPRRPLPRSARDAEDLFPAPARVAADRLWATRAARAVREPEARGRQAELSGRARGASGGRGTRPCRLSDSRLPGAP